MKINTSDFELIEEKVSGIFPLLKNKKIFITGGTGFFGKWLLEAISHLNSVHELGVKLTVLSRDPEKFKSDFSGLSENAYISFVVGDVRDFSYDCIDQDFDYIIHAATDASTTLNKNNPELMRSTILDGMRHIINFAEHVSCKRLLYTSSGAAYGVQPLTLDSISEDYIKHENYINDDAYASAKRESELFLDGCENFDIIIARCFSFSGPYLPLDGTYAFGNFILNRLKNETISINSSGESIRTYLYAADLVIWLLTLLVKGKNKCIYNVGSDEEISILDLAKKISNDKVDVLAYGEIGVGVTRYVPDIVKAKDELGLDIYTKIDDAILKTLKFYLNS